MSKKDIICVLCPKGCQMTVEKNAEAESGYVVDGYNCKKGIGYGVEEMSDPRRNITSTVIIKGSHLARLPVRTSNPIPKDKIFDCMVEINKIRLNAPAKMGDILIKNILGTEIDILASRSLDKI